VEKVMDKFEEELSSLISHIVENKLDVKSEEQTKHSFVIPFIELL
jgi:hypothetical protein